MNKSAEAIIADLEAKNADMRRQITENEWVVNQLRPSIPVVKVKFPVAETPIVAQVAKAVCKPKCHYDRVFARGEFKARVLQEF